MMEKREDGFEQLVDGEGITIQSNEIFLFKCCDCGLVHKMVVATEEDQELGFAIERVPDTKCTLDNLIAEGEIYSIKVEDD